MIGADRVWKDLGVTGKGVIVGQSDSGVQGDHPELADAYRGRTGGNDYNWYDPWNGSTAPVDIGGHGTHTLGSILGKQVGMAPGAEWIGCVNLARNLGNPAYYLDCWQFMLAPFPAEWQPVKDGDPTKGAMVLNNSWGCPKIEGCDPDVFLPAVKALRDAGIFVVVSAGNSGEFGCGTVEDPPSIYDQVYSVGAVDQQGNRASFSSLGPVTVDGSNRIKPDIAAPGEGILSSFPGNSYATLSGTSMAGPHVVGVVALMWSANPKLIGDIDRTTQILNQSAKQYNGQLPACVKGQGTPNDATGYGILNAFNAVQMAQEAAVMPPATIRKLTLEECDQAKGVTVVIDVLRAFSAEAYAFHQGAREIIAVSTVEEALLWKEREPSILVMGEVNGYSVPGFDLWNSPGELVQLDLSGRRLVHRTTAGTQGIIGSAQALSVYAASFVVARATANSAALPLDR